MELWKQSGIVRGGYNKCASSITQHKPAVARNGGEEEGHDSEESYTAPMEMMSINFEEALAKKKKKGYCH